MRFNLLVLVFCFCTINLSYSQEDNGVVALNIPLRNSLTFNTFAINPTFTFVREQNKYISISNKREWTQFENAPVTYLAAYSGRFGENIGAGVNLFQQNYGVLTTFGGILNFAYNVRLERDSNLTFGLNIGAYKSGLNTGSVSSNFEDPSIQNIPNNFLVTVNPGINYGTGFLDFGLSLKNLVTYNLKTSLILEDNKEQGVQGHIMYTGYIESRGFFDESKFTTLIQSEFRKDETILSGLAMFTIPRGIWLQAGYNTVYGASAGLGLNITPNIAVEYNYEKSLGDLTDFGSSHEITLAYRFIKTGEYKYNSGDEVAGLIAGNPKVRRSGKVKKSPPKSVIAKVEVPKEENVTVIDENTVKKAEIAAQNAAKEKEEEIARLLVKQQKEVDVQAKILAEENAKLEAEAQLARQKARNKINEDARLAAEKAKEEEALANKRAEQELKTQAEIAAKAQVEQDLKAKAEAIAIAEKSKEAEKIQLENELKAKENITVENKPEAENDAISQLLANQSTILNSNDNASKEMLDVVKEANVLKSTQNSLLQRFENIINVKNQDLLDLKEENDLGDQGIAVAPKPFKSLSDENNILKSIKADLDKTIASRSDELTKLRKLYQNKSKIGETSLDEVNLYYRKAIVELELEQREAVTLRENLSAKLLNINSKTEYERSRRIKRASYDNEKDRFSQDRITLERLKKDFSKNAVSYTESDFDFGEEYNDNVTIVENIKDAENGFYLVIATHRNTTKRDEFLTKVIQSGRKDVDFFYYVNSGQYYIYYSKFDNIQAATSALNSRTNVPYNAKMTIVKIEN